MLVSYKTASLLPIARQPACATRKRVLGSLIRAANAQSHREAIPVDALAAAPVEKTGTSIDSARAIGGVAGAGKAVTKGVTSGSVSGMAAGMKEAGGELAGGVKGAGSGVAGGVTNAGSAAKRGSVKE